MFDELVSDMHRVALPPVAHSQASDRLALAAESLRQKYINLHGHVLHCIANLRRAWSSLATISPTGLSPPEPAAGSDFSLESSSIPPPTAASDTQTSHAQIDALRAQVRDLQAQLAASSAAAGNAVQSGALTPLTAEGLKKAMQHIKTSVLHETSSAADPPGFDECLMAIACGFLRRDESYLKQVFEKHSASPGAEAGLLKESMRAALKDAHFPLVSGSIATSDDELWGRIDLDSSGRVSFEEFRQFVRQRGSVENWMKTEQFLQILSDSVVPLLGADAGPDDQMRRLAQLAPDQVRRALDAAVIGLNVQYKSSQENLRKTLKAVTEQAERVSQSKFELSKLSCGTIDDFHKGLESRIGVSHI